MDLRFVTTNPGKFREVRATLRPFGVKVRWVRKELPEPQSDDLSAVVRAKLAFLPERTGGAFLVEDSGLFVDALGGFPGVYSAYVLRTLGLEGLLRLVRGRSRAATFRTVAGVRLQGRMWLCRGENRGTIAARARGSGGFGYDPIFIPGGLRKTFAELPPEAKNRLSHRGRAIRAVGRRLALESSPAGNRR